MDDFNARATRTPVVIQSLTRRFARKVALDGVTLRIPQGRVFGLVGENGAGKTTLIRLILGLLQPDGGAVDVFGMDPIEQPEEVLSRIGYLSENRDLPGWMRVRELMLFMQPFYPKWDPKYAEELRELFGLDPKAKVRTLSRGQRAQLGLLLALAHRPELLVLDEPSSGLDPVVRRDILSAIIRTVADEGRTVLFSSHLLDEVEFVADDVAMLHGGRLVCAEPMDKLKARYRAFTIRLPNAEDAPPALPKALAVERAGNEWAVLWEGDPEAARQTFAGFHASIIEDGEPSLEDILIAYVRTKRARAAQEV